MKPTIILGLVVLVSFCIFTTHATLKKYHGYQLIRAQAETNKHVSSLLELTSSGKYDVWHEPHSRGHADIFVGPHEVEELKMSLNAHEIKYHVSIPDVEKVLVEQRKSQAEAKRNNPQNFMNWLSYQELDTIYNWMHNLTLVYPSTVTMETIGQSYEGRDIKVMKISSGEANRTKSVFWMDATIHSREWIATASATYMLNELVTKPHLYWDILSQFDFYILPVVNPDGYVYTHTTNRMWRKTRQSHGGSCVGVDANRNFGFHFGGQGSSGDPCSESFRGPVAYSEPEANALKNYVLNITNPRKTAFLTLHSYGQLWLTPWGYTTDYPTDYTELVRVANITVANLTAVHGTEYTIGSSANALYPSSGTSRDWAKGEGGFRYVYTVEMRDTGLFGFILPAEQIIPNVQEVWAGIQAMAREVGTLEN